MFLGKELGARSQDPACYNTDLFSTTADLVESAYDLQGERIAYVKKGA